MASKKIAIPEMPEDPSNPNTCHVRIHRVTKRGQIGREIDRVFVGEYGKAQEMAREINNANR